ncbi:MAG: transcriptional regulator [Verrucomicrobiales bacterium]|nr:transcriptional regulator [Verrucomicrobiales bacterium]
MSSTPQVQVQDTEQFSNKSKDSEPLEKIQREVIALFVNGVRVLGLPKSIGEIYGLLFISPDPLALDVIVRKLQISKGSVSQGLRFLRNLGAVKPVYVSGDRRDHFTAVAELKKLANGFIKGELNPNLESVAIRLNELKAMAKNDISPNADFFQERIRRIGNWRRRGGMLLKIVNRFLGRTTQV